MYHKIDIKRHVGNPLTKLYDVVLYTRGSDKATYIRKASFEWVQQLIFDNPNLEIKNDLSYPIASLFKWRDPTRVDKYGIAYRTLIQRRKDIKEGKANINYW